MVGARDLAKVFKTGQYDGLYIVSGRHARGRTFHVYVLPPGEDAKPNGENNPPLNKDAVEVYGIVSGNPGWTETYGWIHDGPWQNDFALQLNSRMLEIEARAKRELCETLESEERERSRIADLLGSYKCQADGE